MKIGVYTSVCEEDANWIPQYLHEIERLGLGFAINFDRCSAELKALVIGHPQLVGYTEQDDPNIEFTEKHKQGAFDIIVNAGFDWALAWDVDETWEKDAPEKLKALETIEEDYLDCPWMNLWGDEKHLRMDPPFNQGHRVKFYRLKRGWNWHFDHPITNGAKHSDPHRTPVEGKFNLVCLHWGMMTREMRLFHKERWDRIYTAAVGKNPYGFWNHALDETIEPKVVPNPYL